MKDTRNPVKENEQEKFRKMKAVKPEGGETEDIILCDLLIVYFFCIISLIDLLFVICGRIQGSKANSKEDIQERREV